VGVFFPFKGVPVQNCGMIHSAIEKLLTWVRRLLPVSRDTDESLPSPDDRREHVRFKYSYAVTIFCGMKKFETFCKDISLGGMKLKHPLPPSMVGKQCKVSIADNLHREPIVFNSTVIADTETPMRISFSGTDAESHTRLKSWLQQRVISDQIKKELTD